MRTPLGSTSVNSTVARRAQVYLTRVIRFADEPSAASVGPPGHLPLDLHGHAADREGDHTLAFRTGFNLYPFAFAMDGVVEILRDAAKSSPTTCAARQVDAGHGRWRGYHQTVD